MSSRRSSWLQRILRRLLVQEGDFVDAGQPLVELDDTRARAELAQLHGKRTSLLARLARLRAERDLSDEIVFPEELKNSSEPLIAEVVAAEEGVFEKRRQVYEGKIAFQQKEMEQYVAQIEANGASDAEIVAVLGAFTRPWEHSPAQVAAE